MNSSILKWWSKKRSVKQFLRRRIGCQSICANYDHHLKDTSIDHQFTLDIFYFNCAEALRLTLTLEYPSRRTRMEWWSPSLQFFLQLTCLLKSLMRWVWHSSSQRVSELHHSRSTVIPINITFVNTASCSQTEYVKVPKWIIKVQHLKLKWTSKVYFARDYNGLR